MGSSVIKIKKDTKQINLDISEINKITKNKLFEKRVGFLIRRVSTILIGASALIDPKN